jgi:hypothetical protein
VASPAVSLGLVGVGWPLRPDSTRGPVSRPLPSRPKQEPARAPACARNSPFAYASPLMPTSVLAGWLRPTFGVAKNRTGPRRPTPSEMWTHEPTTQSARDSRYTGGSIELASLPKVLLTPQVGGSNRGRVAGCRPLRCGNVTDLFRSTLRDPIIMRCINDARLGVVTVHGVVRGFPARPAGIGASRTGPGADTDAVRVRVNELLDAAQLRPSQPPSEFRSGDGECADCQPAGNLPKKGVKVAGGNCRRCHLTVLTPATY